MEELAVRLGGQLLAAAAETSMRHLDHEAFNLRAAIDWSLTQDAADRGLRIAGATWRWYQQRGRLREGRWLLGALLARPGGVAHAQTLRSALSFRLDEPAVAWRTVTDALLFFSAGNLASGTARAMVMAAILQIVHGDPELGSRIAGATYELAREQNVMLAP